jgi:acyl-CoA hydrolase
MRLMNRAGDTNRGNWQQEYNKKICTPEEALSVIRDHDTLGRRKRGAGSLGQGFESKRQ